MVAGMAAASAACGRARPSATHPVTEFIVASTALGKLPSLKGLTPAQALSALTAAESAWWGPILKAFNDTHPRLRASFGPDGADPTATPGGGDAINFGLNPDVSCRVDDVLDTDVVDLAAAMRDANIDATALLPGLLQAATDRRGAILGIPVNFELLGLAYSGDALQKAHVSPPPTAGWSLSEFSAAVEALAAKGPRGAVFGEGLAVQTDSSQAPAWFGFAEGYSGNVFGDRVVLASGPVYAGLKAYAGLLQLTWAGPPLNPAAALGFSDVGVAVSRTSGVRPDVSRFPRLPSPAVPADVRVAKVPAAAPRAAAGATFAVWLASVEGQKALIALGYPGVRTDEAGGAFFSQGQNGLRPSDLRFRPGGIFGIEDQHAYGFDPRIVAALLQPEPERLRRLRRLEQALTGVLDGSLTRAQAGAMLDREGVATQ